MALLIATDDLAARAYPADTATPLQDAIFRGNHAGIPGADRGEAVAHRGAVFGVDAFQIFFRGQRRVTFLVVQDVAQAIRYYNPLGSQVPIPQAIVRTFENEFPALIAFEQPCFHALLLGN